MKAANKNDTNLYKYSVTTRIFELCLCRLQSITKLKKNWEGACQRGCCVFHVQSSTETENIYKALQDYN